MTDYEIEKEMNSMSCGWNNGHYIRGTEQEERRRKELSCMGMINSILAYGGFGLSAEELIWKQEKLGGGYLMDYIELLGRQTVIKLIEEQNVSIECINYGTATDGEGNVYNSIQWCQTNNNMEDMK